MLRSKSHHTPKKAAQHKTTTKKHQKTQKKQKRSLTTTTTPKSPKILVIGAIGQVGTDLVKGLRDIYPAEDVIATDVRPAPAGYPAGPFQYLDCMDQAAINKTIVDNNITWVVHLASILSAAGEKNPQFALKLNTRGIENVLESAKNYNLRVFSPSTIAAFGPHSQRDNTPDYTIQDPTTVYGVSKVYLELLGQYYKNKFGVDFRSMRYPGIISAVEPGGGTTDYAVDVFFKALLDGKYTCFLEADTPLPMMYGTDAIQSTIELIQAPKEKLTQCTYNVTGFSFTPAQVAISIKKFIPHFEMDYAPDFRQAIADTWPRSLDDTTLRRDTGWQPEFDTCDKLTEKMLTVIHERLTQEHPGKVLHWTPPQTNGQTAKM